MRLTLVKNTKVKRVTIFREQTSSSSRKNERYWQLMSTYKVFVKLCRLDIQLFVMINSLKLGILKCTSVSPPFSLCSSIVSFPPEKAYLLILVLIYLGVSVKQMELVVSLADIFVWAPCIASSYLNFLLVSVFPLVLYNSYLICACIAGKKEL